MVRGWAPAAHQVSASITRLAARPHSEGLRGSEELVLSDYHKLPRQAPVEIQAFHSGHSDKACSSAHSVGIQYLESTTQSALM